MESLHPKEYDVFLSYNKKDHHIVERLARLLSDYGLRVWFDDWRMPPGTPVMDAIEAGLGSSTAAAVFIGAKGLGKWQRKEVRHAFQMYSEKGRRIIPVLLPDAPAKPRMPFGMSEQRRVSFRKGCDFITSFGDLIWGITNARPSAQSLGCIVPEADPLYELQSWDAVLRLRRSGWYELTAVVSRAVLAPELSAFHHSYTARPGRLDHFRFGRLRLLTPNHGRRIWRQSEVVDGRSARWEIAVDPAVRSGESIKYEGRVSWRNDAALTAERLEAEPELSPGEYICGYRGIGAVPSLRRFSAVLVLPREYPVHEVSPFASRQSTRLPDVERHLARHVQRRDTGRSTQFSLTLEPPPRTVRVGLVYRPPARSEIPVSLRRALGIE